MKRWLRSLSFQELSPLNLTPTGSPTSPNTPTGTKCRIQHLGAVGENDYVGDAVTNAQVSNVSIINADKTVEEAAEYGHGTGSTRVVLTGTTSSPRFPSDIRKKPGKDISSHELGLEAQEVTKNEQEGNEHSKQLSLKVADLVQKVHDLKEREIALVQRLKSLTTINQDDERRLNQFIDVLRQSPLSPLSPHPTKNSAEQEEAEQTLTKLERLFVRSTESCEKVEKEMSAVKKDLALAREGLETELIKRSSESEHTNTIKSPDRSLYPEDTSNQIDKFMQELRAYETDLDGSKAKSISNISPEMQPLPASAKLLSSNIDSEPPRSTLEEALERAKCRLATAQVTFDNLPNQYALDAQTYHETYQSCLKTVTDFDLEHLVQGQQASRELAEAEIALEKLKKQIFTTEQAKRKQNQGHAPEDSAPYPIDQTSAFLTNSEDGYNPRPRTPRRNPKRRPRPRRALAPPHRPQLLSRLRFRKRNSGRLKLSKSQHLPTPTRVPVQAKAQPRSHNNRPPGPLLRRKHLRHVQRPLPPPHRTLEPLHPPDPTHPRPRHLAPEPNPGPGQSSADDTRHHASNPSPKPKPSPRTNPPAQAKPRPRHPPKQHRLPTQRQFQRARPLGTQRLRRQRGAPERGEQSGSGPESESRREDGDPARR